MSHLLVNKEIQTLIPIAHDRDLAVEGSKLD